jgi:hypothetical protein
MRNSWPATVRGWRTRRRIRSAATVARRRADAREQERELVAAYARHGTPSRIVSLNSRRLLKELVAAGAPNGVVDELEPIEAKEHYATFSRPARLRQADAQTFFEEHTIRHSVAIVAREMADRLSFFIAADIADEGAKPWYRRDRGHHRELDRELAPGAGGRLPGVFSTRPRRSR